MLTNFQYWYFMARNGVAKYKFCGKNFISASSVLALALSRALLCFGNDARHSYCR